VRGEVARVADSEADAYFATRPRLSRVGAWASQQSRPLAARSELEEAFAAFSEKFGEGDIPRPAYWGGYRLAPSQIEFWQDGKFRLHDRVRFAREAEGQPWSRERLFP